MRAFVLTLAAGLALAASLAGFVDPARTGWRRVHLPAGGIPSGQVFVHPGNVDERVLKRELLASGRAEPEARDLPEVIVLASSRGMTLGEQEFRQPAKVVNLGMSGASAEDYLALGELVLERPNAPRDVVLSLDPWVFNRRSGQKRWVSNVDALNRFYEQRDPDPFAVVHAGWTRVSMKLTSLLGFSAVRAAAQSEWQQLRAKQEPPLPHLADEAALAPTDSGTRADGSIRYPASETRLLTVAESRQAAEEYARAEPVYSLGGWEVDPSTEERLERLIAAFRGRGVEVHLLVLPYHPRVLELLRARPGYAPILDEYEQVMHHLASTSGASLCDMLDPAGAGCGETEFIDGMHAQQSCVRKWAAACGLGEIPRR